MPWELRLVAGLWRIATRRMCGESLGGRLAVLRPHEASMHGDVTVPLHRDDGAGKCQEMRSPRHVLLVELAHASAKLGQPALHGLSFGRIRAFALALLARIRG